MKNLKIKNWKWAMFRIYNDEDVSRTLDKAVLIVKSNTDETRNILSKIPIVFDSLLHGGYYEITKRGHVQKREIVLVGETLKIPFTISEIKKGDYIYRYNGRQLGCGRFSDYRQCLNIVVVDRVCEKTIIGAKGEIVRQEQIIIITREGVKQ